MGTIINTIGSLYYNVDPIADAILWALGIFGIHGALYWIIGFFFTRKFKPAKQMHKYAILLLLKDKT